MNIYMIQEEGEQKFWLGKSMEAALADAWDDYIREQDIAGSDYEKAREIYAQDTLQSCTFIGELEQIKSKPSAAQWTPAEMQKMLVKNQMDPLKTIDEAIEKCVEKRVDEEIVNSFGEAGGGYWFMPLFNTRAAPKNPLDIAICYQPNEGGEKIIYHELLDEYVMQRIEDDPQHYREVGIRLAGELEMLAKRIREAIGRI